MTTHNRRHTPSPPATAHASAEREVLKPSAVVRSERSAFTSIERLVGCGDKHSKDISSIKSSSNNISSNISSSSSSSQRSNMRSIRSLLALGASGVSDSVARVCFSTNADADKAAVHGDGNVDDNNDECDRCNSDDNDSCVDVDGDK
jgi:hypothetical protein